LLGAGPQPGEIFRNPGLARTLRTLAEHGKEAYYQGPIAASIVETLRAAGGCMSESDLADHTSTWDMPISVPYRDLRVWECPPNGQGLTALLALNILEGFELSGLPPLSPSRLHLMIEALRLAFADARHYVSDPVFSDLPLAELLSKEYAAQRRALIDPLRAMQHVMHGTPLASSDTVYLSVVDGRAMPVLSSTAIIRGLVRGLFLKDGASACKTGGQTSACNLATLTPWRLANVLTTPLFLHWQLTDPMIHCTPVLA
jgi:gamma-glutamyltranspeptidase / glutathione hydrolase